MALLFICVQRRTLEERFALQLLNKPKLTLIRQTKGFVFVAKPGNGWHQHKLSRTSKTKKKTGHINLTCIYTIADGELALVILPTQATLRIIYAFGLVWQCPYKFAITQVHYIRFGNRHKGKLITWHELCCNCLPRICIEASVVVWSFLGNIFRSFTMVSKIFWHSDDYSRTYHDVAMLLFVFLNLAATFLTRVEVFKFCGVTVI